MKRYLFCIVVAFVQVSYAQNYLDLNVPLPPEVSVFETIELDDCTYIRETVDEGSVYLYKEGSHSRKDEPTYLNGEQVPDEVYWTKEGQFSVQPNAKQAQQMLSIVDEAFTMEQADVLRGTFMFIELRVSSITGELTDVYFSFASESPYANIPIEVFCNIEREMKNELLFEITDFGKSLTYSSLGWAHYPKGRAEESATETEEETNENEIETEVKVVAPIGGAVSKGTLTPTLNRIIR